MSIITKPNNIVDGNDAFGSEVDANFNVIYNDYNGNQTTANLADDAGIVNGQIAENTLTIERMNLRDFIGGLITQNGTDADHDINIAVGICRDENNVEGLTLGSILVKQIDAGFAVGTNAGGLDTGSVANDTLYAIWLIKRTDTNVVDAIFSTSFSAPTMPTDYTRRRLIASVLTDGSANIIGYVQLGDYFRYLGDTPRDVSDGSITSNTFETGTLSVPPNSVAHMYVRLTNSTSTDTNGFVNVKRVGSSEAASNLTAFLGTDMGGVTFDEFTTQGFCAVDGSSQIQYSAVEASGAATVQIRTIGFFMIGRRDVGVLP